MNALRLAVGTFTIFPTRPVPTPIDRATARGAMLLAPAIGLLLGALAAAVLQGVRWIGASAYDDLLGAALAVAVLAYLTRALHLDGLADTADALGSGKDADAALAIARRGDVGAFGVAALVLTLLVEVAAIAAAGAAGQGTVALVIGVAPGRLAAAWGCAHGLPAARPDGLGALVAGTVPRVGAALWTLALVGLAFALSLASGLPAARAALVSGLAVVGGLLCALLLVRRCVRRLGGITGDVLGAATESATALAFVIIALGATVGP
ncbi:MAG: adenosylcobinamide-GDP ribazoletransferase [bacterium]